MTNGQPVAKLRLSSEQIAILSQLFANAMYDADVAKQYINDPVEALTKAGVSDQDIRQIADYFYQFKRELQEVLIGYDAW